MKNRCLLHNWDLVKSGDQAVLADIKLRGYEIISSPKAKNKNREEVAFLCKMLINSKKQSLVNLTFLKF